MSVTNSGWVNTYPDGSNGYPGAGKLNPDGRKLYPADQNPYPFSKKQLSGRDARLSGRGKTQSGSRNLPILPGGKVIRERYCKDSNLSKRWNPFLISHRKKCQHWIGSNYAALILS